jgi:hypothetical protein
MPDNAGSLSFPVCQFTPGIAVNQMKPFPRNLAAFVTLPFCDVVSVTLGAELKPLRKCFVCSEVSTFPVYLLVVKEDTPWCENCFLKTPLYRFQNLLE